MKRRLFCILLTALMLLSFIPATAPQASAASDLKTSESAISVLKQLEGFISKPIYDHGQYSVGYGSGCAKNDYPNGITEAEADALLRKYLVGMEKSVNYFASRYNLTLSQNQFDALMLFTYNLGANWVNADGEFRQAVIDGAKGNDFIYPITLWSNASSQLNINLVKRRLIEANMYLNGGYSASKPSNYTYVQYDTNGGISDVKVQGYDSNLTASPKAVPILSGYRFMGWYTAKEGGSWVTSLNASTGEKTLYAHWQKGSGDVSEGTAASYQRTANQITTLDIYKTPGGETSGALDANATVKIVADYVDASNVKWGKLENGGWVNLGNTLVGIVTSHAAQDPVTVTVTNSYINVRSGPGTSYAKVGTVYQNQQLEITETRLLGSDKWGRFSGGWISLMYTDYDSVLEDASADTTTVTATGTIVNCSSLRIRSGAGTNYPILGSLPAGTRVEITQQKTGSGMTWGKISSGWISLTYVSLDSTSTEQEKNPDSSEAETITVKVTNSYINVRSGPNTTYAKVGTVYQGQELNLTETKLMGTDMWGKFSGGWVSLMYTNYDSVVKGTTQTPESQTPSSGTAGTVISNCPLNIRTGAGTHNTQIGTYASGTRITILEQTNLNGEVWGKTDRGWVCMTYVKLDGTAAETKPETEEKTETETTPSNGSVNGTVISNTALNIRSGAGTGNTQIGTYTPGTRITILEQTNLNGEMWGRTDRGWVCLTYVQLDSSLAASSFSGTVNTAGLRIRSAAGTENTILGYYNTGDKVDVLETCYVSGVAWGRTDKGWICLDYVNK